MTKEEFLRDVSDWCNHRYFLWQALEATKHVKRPVLELGSGYGSTPFLRQYCQDEGLTFMTFDSNEKYAREFDSVYVSSWEEIPWGIQYSVVLVDEAPGEHRKESIMRLKNNCQIMIVHDSEPPGWNASDYQVRLLFDEFLYMKDWRPDKKPDAWTTALSDLFDVRSFDDGRRHEYSEPTNY